jgi:hypothetical protein
VIGDIIKPVGTSGSANGLTIPGAIRRDPSAATPCARQCS